MVNSLTVLENSNLTSLGLGSLAYSPGDADDSAQTIAITVTAVPTVTLGNVYLADGRASIRLRKLIKNVLFESQIEGILFSRVGALGHHRDRLCQIGN